MAERQSGFTLVELLLAMTVLLFAMLALSQTLGAAKKLGGVNRETALAQDGIREMVELLQGAEDFSELFILYNEDPDDDPGLPGTAPGPGFAIAGLAPADGDADGFVGEIRFPAQWGVASLELREDFLDDSLGMPRDLNGDGLTDALDHSGDYRLLPISLMVRWQGKSGERTLEIQTLLADR